MTELVPCPACGIRLPGHARFCSGCGIRLPGLGVAPPVPRWLLAVFWLGTALAAGVALLYAALLVSPDLSGQALAGPVPAGGRDRMRPGAALLALCALSVFTAQLLASIGLWRRRPWARVLATMLCVAWSLTCIGLPLSVLGLRGLWHSTNR